ncbi:mRNA capping enzyme-domain-containing protein [Trametes meyenii]|nr:mRNA capping enzyme-domain-containing protein [Trametes meyenii]
MPAFDPVRDAVLNSPITSSLALPSSARSMHIDVGPAKSPNPPRHHTQPLSSTPGSGMSVLTAPSSATTSPSELSPGVALVSPLTRRATDLSVLLNSDPPPALDTPLFTPTTPRAPATLSHLLLPDSDDPPEVEQLSYSTPLRRRSSASTAQLATPTAREAREASSYFTHPGSINNRPSSSSSSAALGGPVRVMERPPPRELAGLVLPGGAATTTVPSALALPGGAGSRPTTASSVPATATASSSRPSSSSASMPPPPQAPQRSPPVSTVSLPSAPAAPPSKPQQSQSQLQSQPQRPTTRPASPVRAPVPPPAPSAPARTASPATQKPPASRQRTSSGNGVPPQSSSLPPPASSLPPKPLPPPPSAMKRSAIPYAPRRKTPATSVLIPLSPAEMERYRNYTGGVGTMILRKQKRVENLLGDGPPPAKRDREDEDTSEENPRKKRRSGDVAVVVEHYNARPDVGVAQRQESPIIGLKSFNNWVKSVLITRFAHPALSASPSAQRRGSRMRGRVLDMGCGKGGDLNKWAKADVAEYVGLDIAKVSIDQAQHRHATSRGARFVADFFALDCYSNVLSDVLPSKLFTNPFDVVSMQFCMHYAFENETKARTMLKNVATWLRPGGVFVGTIPNAKQLMDQLDDAKDLSWGNNVYKIRFEERERRPVFGHRYWFYLKDAVDDVPEYVVHWDNFVELAAEYGLHPIYKKEFHEVFEEFSEHEEFAPLLQRMRVVDSNGESQMDEDQWEAANIYIGFALEKR